MSDELEITPKIARAIKRLVGNVDGKGITAVTFSIPGKSVTIDQAAAERIKKNADKIIKESKP